SSQSKRQSEKQPRDHADSSWHEFLGVNEDGGKSGSQGEADDHAKKAGPEKIGVGQDQGEREYAQDGAPDDVFTADSIAYRATDESSRGDRSEKHEEVQLRILKGKVKFAHQIKRVVVHQAGEIEEF